MDILRAVLALIFVLGLIGLCVIAARRLGLGGLRAGPRFGRDRRLGVVETLALDPRRRLVLLRRDTAEHLVILGPSGETVIERGIEQGAERGAEQGAGRTAGAAFAEHLQDAKQ